MSPVLIPGTGIQGAIEKGFCLETSEEASPRPSVSPHLPASLSRPEEEEGGGGRGAPGSR